MPPMNPKEPTRDLYRLAAFFFGFFFSFFGLSPRPMPQVCHEASPVLRITGGREPRGSLHTGRPEPFDSDQFIFELKIDGFRALAHIENGKGELISRNGNVLGGFCRSLRMDR